MGEETQGREPRKQKKNTACSRNYGKGRWFAVARPVTHLIVFTQDGDKPECLANKYLTTVTICKVRERGCPETLQHTNFLL